MEYKPKQRARIDDLSPLFLKIAEETAGNMQASEKAISKDLNTLFDDNIFSPKDLNPYLIARACILDFERKNEKGDNIQVLNAALTPSMFENVLHTVLTRIAMDEMEFQGGELIGLATQGEADSSTFEDIPAMSPVEELRQRKAGQSFEEVDLGAHLAKCYMYDKGLLLRITQELLWDSVRFEEIITKAESLGESTAMTIAKAITQTVEMGTSRAVFDKDEMASNRAFIIDNTNYQSSFYADDHSAIDGQTNDNLGLAGNGLTWEGLEAAFQLLAAMKDGEGKPITINMRQGLFPMIYKHRVARLLESNPIDYNASGNDGKGTKNTFSGTVLPFFSSHLTSNIPYYLGDFSKALKWRWKERPGMMRFTGGEKEVTNRIVSTFRWAMFFGVCWTDYRFVVKVS